MAVRPAVSVVRLGKKGKTSKMGNGSNTRMMGNGSNTSKCGRTR